jgi:hypothetical protein
MSYPTFPSNVLFTYGYKKTPCFNTVKQIPAAGRGISTMSLKPFCTWQFEADLAYIGGDIWTSSSLVAAFMGLFLATNGGAGFWLFNDPTDNVVSGGNGTLLDVTPGSTTPMASVGNGVSKIFQIARTIGSLGMDIIQSPTVGTLLVNGSSSAYTMTSTGVVTFTTAPPNAATLSWTGGFDFLCCFDEDLLDGLSRVGGNSAGGLWSSNSIKWSSVQI